MLLAYYWRAPFNSLFGVMPLTTRDIIAIRRCENGESLDRILDLLKARHGDAWSSVESEALHHIEVRRKRLKQADQELEQARIVEARFKAESEAAESEFQQLVSEVRRLGFTESKQVSAYIVNNSLGRKYRHISGVLTMRRDDDSWQYHGGFPPEIYARLCHELGLSQQGTNAVPESFTPFKDIVDSE